ncbi:hypothetical protein [Streptomyces albipurpureus]|uniref:DUF8175 domain-containing protein n=1 Tax=Streptomyces albipurpureus TaxID=2897419 RepID=A0ABT0UKY9_9ACTN|nr:hypothetical protein [Streptomyces sp. CWNU-1]MCM2388775.1 hypothetical protein [Streptomyces sp. CWNU-1]
MAIAAGVFTLLLALAVGVRLSNGGSDNESGGSTQTAPAQSAKPGKGAQGAGGDGAVNEQEHVDGVPVGYPRSEGGAVRAAVNYQIARSSARYFTDTSTRRKIITAMAATDSRDRLLRNDDAGMRQVLLALGVTTDNQNELVARAAAMGTKTVSYSDQVATVSLWMTGLIGVSDKSAPLPVSASWTTYTLTLQWQSSDWKLAAISSVNGPTPLDDGGNEPSSVEEFRRADGDFNAPPYTG